jgi:hypothetical protein
MPEPFEPLGVWPPPGAAPPGAAAAGADGAGAATAAPPVPMPFQVLLDEAMRRARRHLRTIYLPISVPVAAITAGIAALQAVWLGPEAMSGTDPWQSIARSCSFVLVALPLGVVMGLLYAAMVVAAVDAVAGRGVDIRRALRFVVRPGVLGAQLLVLVCMVGALVCCVVPAFYVVPLLSLALPAMAEEGVTGAAALRRSAELTQHNPQRRWLTSPIVKILALFAVVMIISYLASLVLVMPVTILQWLTLMRKVAAGQDIQRSMSGILWMQVPLRCLSSFVTSAVYLYSSFAIALMFFDLRARREGDDLRRAIAGMTGAAPEPPPPALLPPLAPPPLVPGSPGSPRPSAAPDSPAPPRWPPEGQGGQTQ